MTDLPDSAELLFDGASGIYIPERFAKEIKRKLVTGVADDDWATLDAGPSGDWYWDAWDDVLNNARVNTSGDPAAPAWATLHQDGDLWLVPEDAEWPEED